MRPVILISIVLLLLICCIECRPTYLVRRGGRLERLQKRTLSEWQRAHHRPRSHRKRRRHERDGRLHVDSVLAHMDSFVRPRFGRSVPS